MTQRLEFASLSDIYRAAREATDASVALDKRNQQLVNNGQAPDEAAIKRLTDHVAEIKAWVDAQDWQHYAEPHKPVVRWPTAAKWFKPQRASSGKSNPKKRSKKYNPDYKSYVFGPLGSTGSDAYPYAQQAQDKGAKSVFIRRGEDDRYYVMFVAPCRIFNHPLEAESKGSRRWKSNPKKRNPVDSGRPSTLRQLYGDRQYRDAAWLSDAGMKPAVVQKLVARGYAMQSGPALKVTWKGMNATEKGAGRLVPTLYGEVGGYALYDTAKGGWLTAGEIYRKVGGIAPKFPVMVRVYGTWQEARDAAKALNPIFAKGKAR